MFCNSFSNCNNNSFSNTFRLPPKSSQELLNCIIAYVMCKQARIQAVTSSSPRHPSSNPTGLSPAVDPPRTPKTHPRLPKTPSKPCQDPAKTPPRHPACVCVASLYLVEQHVWFINRPGRSTCLVEQQVWSSNHMSGRATCLAIGSKCLSLSNELAQLKDVRVRSCGTKSH